MSYKTRFVIYDTQTEEVKAGFFYDREEAEESRSGRIVNEHNTLEIQEVEFK